MSPEMDGGHTALLAVERPSRCKWVAWVASVLVCAEERLLPEPTSPRQQISCKVQPKAQDEPLESGSSSSRSMSSRSSGSGSSDPVDPSSGLAAQASTRHSGTVVASHERLSQPQQPQQQQQEADLERLRGLLQQNLGRPGGVFEIGQVVENLADGTRAVVVGWDGGPTETELAGAHAAASVASSPNYLLLLAAGQLPAFGRLTSEIWGDRPGRAAVVPQAYLRLWRGGRRHTSSSETSVVAAAAAAAAPPPIRLPRGAEGRLFRTYDHSLRRFTPSEELLGQHAASYRDHSGSAGDEMDVGTNHGGSATATGTSGGMADLDALLSEMGLTVQTRRAKAAAQLAEGLSARRIELQEKLETLKTLQARMQSLQSMATELKQAAAGGMPSAEGSSADEAG